MQTIRITTSLTAAQKVGRLIYDLRKERKMTGEELGRRAHISQSRISKIENGYSESIQAGQIEELLNILKAPKTIRQQVAILLFQLTGSAGALFSYPFAEVPEFFNGLQKTTTLFRTYDVNGISAALQTVEYRTAYLKRIGFSNDDIKAEVAKTLERQDALWTGSKEFYVVMPELGLYTMPGSARLQAAQLDRLERVIGFNIHVGVIPTQAGSSFFETGTFMLYDDRLLYLITGDRSIKLEGDEVILKYLNAFEDLSRMACFDAEAIGLIRKAGDYFLGHA
ncbi:MAG TPA: Scr1 family TA system antitoxin-like transcriptional regulator [Candidatus Saccharimonadales bacterium]|jgi:transcriptional regulator with XRE-family HTH domain